MPSSKRLIDGNRIKKIYPFFRQRPNYDIVSPGGGANIEAAVIDFSNQDQKTYTFVETYTQVPICIVSPEDTADVVDSTCDYNNDPTINMDSTSAISVGMQVSGTGIPVGATVASITNGTTFELSASTTGGSVTNGTLTFTSSANVNLYITSITTTQVIIESSEVFTGKVHLHIHESEA